MPKNARKRQKISQAKGSHDSHVDQPSNKAARLQILLDEENKDDEERRLESLLFGVKYVPRGEEYEALSAASHFSESDDSHSDDEQPPISLLAGPARLRKLRRNLDEDFITQKDYEIRLRAQFERLNPEPAWAKKARDAKRNNKNEVWFESETEEEQENVNDITSSTAGILKTKTKKRAVVVPSGTLSIERIRDANQSVQNSGSGDVRVLSFHPKPDVPVLCVATADRRIRLFNVSSILKLLHISHLYLF